jgi:hypothetical protein
LWLILAAVLFETGVASAPQSLAAQIHLLGSDWPIRLLAILFGACALLLFIGPDRLQAWRTTFSGKSSELRSAARLAGPPFAPNDQTRLADQLARLREQARMLKEKTLPSGSDAGATIKRETASLSLSVWQREKEAREWTGEARRVVGDAGLRFLPTFDRGGSPPASIPYGFEPTGSPQSLASYLDSKIDNLGEIIEEIRRGG